MHFIQESEYSKELERIESNPEKADEISRNVESRCSIIKTGSGYGFLLFRHRACELIVSYWTDGSTITLLSIRSRF